MPSSVADDKLVPASGRNDTLGRWPVDDPLDEAQVGNEILKLAYDAALVTLQQQDATLGSLRTRATGLLAAAAVGTSIATGVGLYKAEPGASTLPGWAGWALLGLTLVVGATVMVTLQPTEWVFGAEPSALLDDAVNGKDLDDVYRDATQDLIGCASANLKRIRLRVRAYRIGVAALILQVVVLILGVLLI
jgi:hypothetical protein